MKYPQFIPILFGFLLGAGCHGEKKAAPGAAGTQVDGDRIVLPSGSAQMNSLAVEEVALRRTNTILLTGRLVWNDEVTVRIFSPVGGRVDTLAVNQGQVVAAGDVLARIVSPDFGQAQSDVRKSTADLQLAQRNLARLKTLLEHGATAQKEVEAAEDAYVSDRRRPVVDLYRGGHFRLPTAAGGGLSRCHECELPDHHPVPGARRPIAVDEKALSGGLP